ncbi:hypothetical protein ColTof3_14722 [Colletotrichum tofieldiae]|nr:hypothetical protein ColTof3_14722 [Colletotrichum tofieldiae]
MAPPASSGPGPEPEPKSESKSVLKSKIESGPESNLLLPLLLLSLPAPALPGRWTSDETRYLLRILRNIVGPSSVGRVAERMGRTCYDVAVKVIQLRAAGFPLNTIRPGMAMYLPG